MDRKIKIVIEASDADGMLFKATHEFVGNAMDVEHELLTMAQMFPVAVKAATKQMEDEENEQTKTE